MVNMCHPTPKVVKKELSKIAINASYLDKTPVQKNSFPVAWRILFTFVIQVLGGNYSSTEQVNSIQQLLAYCLITRTEVDIGEIIYSDLVTKLMNKSRQKYISYPIFISCALQVLLGCDYTQDCPHFLFGKKKKVKSQIVTPTLPKSQGLEALESLPQKRKNPLSKKAPKKTKATPPKPTEGSEQSHSVSSGTVHDPQDPERNIQLVGTGLPSTLNEGTRKSQPLPEGTTTDPKDPRGNDPPAVKKFPSTTSNEGTAKTTPRSEGPLRDKDSEGNIPPANMEPINPTVADPSVTGAEYQESDEEEVIAAGDDMEEETQADEEEQQSPSPNKDKLEPSHIQQLKNQTLTPQALTSRNLTISFLSLKDNWSSISERASIKGYYEENIYHREQTNKLVQATMDFLDKTATDRVNLLNVLNGVTETLKAIQDAVKDDHVLNKKVIEATEAYTKNSSALTELLSLVKNFDFQGLKSSVESLQAAALRQNEYLASWAKQDTSEIKSMMSEIYQAFMGQASTPLKPPSYTKGEHVAIEDDKTEEEPTRTVALIEPSSRPLLTDLILEIPTPKVQLITTIISTSQPKPSVPQREGKAIAIDDQPKLTEEQIQAHIDKEEQIKKAVEEAKMFEITKTEVIKVFHEEAKKIRLDPKIIISVKVGEKFKKA
ncbi:hypothetical protein Tco_1195529 [Tanacetum coccineum]